MKIVIEFDFSRERSFNRRRLWRDLSFHRHAYNMRSYRTASDSDRVCTQSSRLLSLSTVHAPAVGTPAYRGRPLPLAVSGTVALHSDSMTVTMLLSRNCGL